MFSRRCWPEPPLPYFPAATACSPSSTQDGGPEIPSPGPEPPPPPPIHVKVDRCGSWSCNWRVGALTAASVASLYACVFWLIYALSLEGGRRPGLFISATCILLLVALGVTLLSVRKLCELLSPPPVPIPV
ncbi:hypothetical protein IscW_ISCW016922 [Ixodes scapularis]|uniref:Transmembrane protein n=1 Tax=Ixodes scapularis TaxID=6945 RepID=B7PDF8_IXOSC|nr:hypothetical protein IscW_ISCW016922 [Ixodes scapularis]|eukprot:XP_002410792.1 hypothetical protein IscW_ISCW016922 [Ixodes scapularis]